MSSQIIADIYRRVQSSPAESTILQVIALAANVQGCNARISYDALALRSGYSQRYTITLIHQLEEKRLLRVQRHRLTYMKHEVNRYDLVCPWRRDITYREALIRKQQTIADRTSEPAVQTGETKRETKSQPIVCSEEECLKAGLTPGSQAYSAAIGLPLEAVEKETDG